MGKDDLLKRQGRSERPFVPAQEEVRQRLDVPCPPPAMQRRVGSPGDCHGEAACLEERFRDAVANDELFMMPGITHERPPVSDCSSEKIALLQRCHGSVRRAPSPRSADRLSNRRPDRRSERHQASVRHAMASLDRGQTTNQKLIMICLKNHSNVTVGIREIHPESIGGIGSPERGRVPVPPEHRSRRIVAEVLLRLAPGVRLWSGGRRPRRRGSPGTHVLGPPSPAARTPTTRSPSRTSEMTRVRSRTSTPADGCRVL